MNVSLMLLILVAYLQDSGVLGTVKSVLGPVEPLVLSGFCAELCQYTKLLTVNLYQDYNGCMIILRS